MKIFAETERLILRELIPEDVVGMFELDSDPEVHKFLGGKPIKDRSQAMEIIGFVRKQYEENGIGRWAIIEKYSNQFMGWSGLKLVQERINDHKNYYDLGYRILRKYWGQGIAGESALASMKYGFNVLNLTEIFAAAHVENNASNQVLKKLGFQRMESFEYDGAHHFWYRIDVLEWMKKTPEQE